MASEIAGLPDGWTAAKDASGKTYYLDATTKTTHWTLPPSAALSLLGSLEGELSFKLHEATYRRHKMLCCGEATDISGVIPVYTRANRLAMNLHYETSNIYEWVSTGTLVLPSGEIFAQISMTGNPMGGVTINLLGTRYGAFTSIGSGGGGGCCGSNSDSQFTHGTNQTATQLQRVDGSGGVYLPDGGGFNCVCFPYPSWVPFYDQYNCFSCCCGWFQGVGPAKSAIGRTEIPLPVQSIVSTQPGPRPATGATIHCVTGAPFNKGLRYLTNVNEVICELGSADPHEVLDTILVGAALATIKSTWQRYVSA